MTNIQSQDEHPFHSYNYQIQNDSVIIQTQTSTTISSESYAYLLQNDSVIRQTHTSTTISSE